MATENSHADALTQDERDAFGRLVARASTFPDHNGRSGPVTRVGYTDLQTVVALLKREILSPVEQPAAAPTIPAGQALVPIERSYDMRVKALIAFNAAEKDGQDRDDALDAAYQATIAAAPQSPTQVDVDDVQVALNTDPRGMHITVWRNRHCIYTAAHALPIVDTAAVASADELVPRFVRTITHKAEIWQGGAKLAVATTDAIAEEIAAALNVHEATATRDGASKSSGTERSEA